MTKITFPIEEAPDFGDALEIAKDILWIRLPLPMALNHVNVYALRDADGWTIVDTGTLTKRNKEIWANLAEGVLKEAPIKRVLITHYHPDHIGCAGWLVKEYGAELLTSRMTLIYTRMLILDQQERPSPEALAFYRGAGMDSDIYEARKDARPFNFIDIVHPLALGYTRLQQGQEIKLAGRRWEIHTGEGHAPEHLTLWSKDDDLAIVGDQILPGISPNVSVHPTEPMANPLEEWLDSCRHFQTIADDKRFLLCGHKLPFKGATPRLRQLIENHENALDRLEAYCETPRVAGECFKILFKRDVGPFEYNLALGEALAHLNYLYFAGRVNRLISETGQWLWQKI